VTPIGLELKLEAQVGDARLRGVIDRLELDADGELVVTDYKTGGVPSERWEGKSLSGVHTYALLCEQMLGRRPARVQLYYLQKPEAIIATTSDQTVGGVSRRTSALWNAIERSCSRDDFRPSPSKLCEWCAFQAYCPAFGGDPRDAPEQSGAVAGGRDGAAARPDMTEQSGAVAGGRDGAAARPDVTELTGAPSS
jgi:putative RecB family exonuclease